MTKTRKEILVIGLMLLLVIALIGVSYAAFRFMGVGQRENTITTGSITMSYTESSNTISLTGALPTTDKTGMKRLNPGEYFDFTVSSKIVGNVNINYEISAKEIGKGTIDGKYIKLYLTRIKEDGTEEDLMAPEVYNEDDTTNEYTGRPNGEMSLYTSSMNNSESNKYRLRMYVDESYNPQDDGGGLTFSVQVNVYGKSGDKYVPETTKTILVANEVQEEKPNMFNYTSSGNYISYFDPEDGPEEANDPSYITNGLYSAEDEDGTSYYFRGSNVNNHVQFGEYNNDYYVYRYTNSTGYVTYDFATLEECQSYATDDKGICSESNRVLKYSKGTPIYWRIVRINGDGSLRLIYNGTSTSATDKDLTIGYGYYNYNYDNPKYTGYTYDRDINETDSVIKKDVDAWYKVALVGSSYDNKVIGGRFCSDSSGYKSSSDYGMDIDYMFSSSEYLFAGYDRLGQSITNFSKPNTPTLKCPSTSESYGGSYRLKVGLITADEVVLAGESYYLSGNSYLNDSSFSYWTMTPSGYKFVFNPNFYGLRDTLVAFINYIRPVINVSISGDFTSGDGTATNPYVIQ